MYHLSNIRGSCSCTAYTAKEDQEGVAQEEQDVIDRYYFSRYQYPEQPPSSEQFEQQEQFEEGNYNMNNTYHIKYIFILHFNIVL